jgi:ATP-dependent Clp protease adapter protein ClpS
MSALSQDLHRSIRRACAIAREQCHACATPEHLLLSLTDDPDAAPVMRACDVDLEQLRRAVAMSLPRASGDPEARSAIIDPRPNASFQRIVQDAVRHVHSVDKDVVTGAHVLVGIFAEPAARFLSEQGMTRYDAVTYVCHGIVKQPGPAPEAAAIFESGAKSDDTIDRSACEVVLQNDDYTPMEFVVWVLQEVFRVTHEDAVDTMLSVNKNGTGSCGVYGRTEGQDLARRVIALAREHHHPLRCVLKPAAQRPQGLPRLVARAVTVLVPREFLPGWVERRAGWQ